MSKSLMNLTFLQLLHMVVLIKKKTLRKKFEFLLTIVCINILKRIPLDVHIYIIQN